CHLLRERRVAGARAVACSATLCSGCDTPYRMKTTTSNRARILILDFGAQYTQLIARRVRELHTYCEIHPHDVSDGFVHDFGAAGIILSGGPASVIETDTPRAPDAVWSAGVPVLGICYGMQTMAAQLGGAVENGLV